MKTYKDIYWWAYPLLACILLITGGCSDNGELDSYPAFTPIHVLRFTDNFTKDTPEVITVNADAQTVTLTLKAVENVEGIDIPTPTELLCKADIWNEEKQRWESVKDEDIMSEDGKNPSLFFHIDGVKDGDIGYEESTNHGIYYRLDGVKIENTSFNITLTSNKSEKERKISLCIDGLDGVYKDNLDTFVAYGYVEIIQLPASSEANEESLSHN